MRRVFNLSIILLLLLGSSFTAQADFTKTKIAVLDFQLQGEKFNIDDMGVIVAEWFITAMVREGRFDVVERRLLQKILSEQELAMSGVVDANSATQIGKLLGVKVIITGSVMKLRDVIEINARIIDVESASIIAAENVKSHITTRLQDLVVEMSQKIMKNFPLEGYVVNRVGESVTLDLGIRTGVKTNMRFLVYKEGQVIKHPKTGEVLDVERIETGTLKITEVRQKICKAIIIEESSAGSINYGQMVKSLVDSSPQSTQLTIVTSPEDAKIRILNIVPTFTQGMILKPGPYHVDISAPGYTTIREWINLLESEQKTFTYSLESTNDRRTQPSTNSEISSKSSYTQPAATMKGSSSNLTEKQKKYIRMLQSQSSRQYKDAAKRIMRSRTTDTVLYDAVEKALLENFRKSSADRHHIDAMAWLCKALGASGNKKYRSTLNLVATQSNSRKLNGYAQKSLNKL